VLPGPEEASESKLALAELALEEGRAAEAERGAREARAAFEDGRRPDKTALALAVEARSFLIQGKQAEAETTIERARDLIAGNQEPEIRLRVTMAGARVRASSGAVDQAIRDLETALVESRRLGLDFLRFPILLTLGQIELDAGRTDTGGTRLESLMREAQARGFGLTAQKAQAALRARRFAR
jgi:hypothetical protein